MNSTLSFTLDYIVKPAERRPKQQNICDKHVEQAMQLELEEATI